MPTEHLLLNPDFPLCWEEPETLRFGFDRVVARLREPSPGIQHLLARLRDGVSRSDLSLLAVQYDISAEQLEQLLEKLAPVILTKQRTTQESRPPAVPADSLVVLGPESTAEHFRARGSLLGFRAPQPNVTPDFAILVEHFWGATARSHALLREQVPHLCIRFTDRAFFIGPILLVAGPLCHNCIELQALAVDPQLRLVAAQLAATQPAALTKASINYATLLAFTAIQRWQHGSNELLSQRLRVPVRNGLPSLRPKLERLTAHEQCACVELKLAQQGRSLATELEAGLFDKTRGQPL